MAKRRCNVHGAGERKIAGREHRPRSDLHVVDGALGMYVEYACTSVNKTRSSGKFAWGR